VNFDWSETPLHWIDDDPVNTHVINVLHLLLPAGERWFCNVYRRFLPRVEDEALRADVKGFIGQEAVHSRAHAAVLEHLASQGVDTSAYTRTVDWLFDKLLGDGRDDDWLPDWLAEQAVRQRLAFIAAIEHFTCVLGEWVIEAEGLDDDQVDPVMRDLLRWHGAEEVEHRSVAHDLYTYVDGSYPRRVLAMAGVAPMMALMWAVGTGYLLRSDPTVKAPGPLATARRFREGVRGGRVPSLRLLIKAVPRYMRRDYHPSQEASLDKALAYLASSPAAQAYR
jgi:hypothetical protein